MSDCCDNLSYIFPSDASVNSYESRLNLKGNAVGTVVRLGVDEPEETDRNEKLKVFLRIRPAEMDKNLYTIKDNVLEVEAPQDSCAYRNVPKNVGKLTHRFRFSSIFDVDASQESVFDDCVLHSLTRFLSGENFLLLAYGTTNAGKTFTMQGTTEKPGVIPRAIQFVFDSLKDNVDAVCPYQPVRCHDIRRLDDEQLRRQDLHKDFILNLDLSRYQLNDPSLRAYRGESGTSQRLSNKSSDSYENVTYREMENNMRKTSCRMSDDRCSLWISMIEIYNEHVYDLLEAPDEKGTRVKLAIAEDNHGNVYVKGLRYVHVRTGHEAFKILEFGRANSQLAPTALNPTSSRSHCIFTFALARFLSDVDPRSVILSRFSLCDLAGTERVKKTLNTGNRLAEAKSINTSLLIFTKCLTVMKENQSSRGKKMVPYRESKLTRLFRDAMLAKERLSIIVNLTPEPLLFYESLNVLKFSAVAQEIVAAPVFPNAKRVIDKTRFSRVVSKADDTRKIIWEASTVADVQDDEAAIKNLVELVDKLKSELSEERHRSKTMEIQLRRELVGQFSALIKKYDECGTARLERESQRMRDVYKMKEKKLLERFKRREASAKKRKVEEDADEVDVTDEDSDNENERLRKEIELLCAETESLRGTIQAVTAENSNLKIKCRQMEFDLSDKARITRLYTDSDDGRSGLEKELLDARNKVKELKGLLDESAFAYRDLLDTNRSMKEENTRLISQLATKAEEEESSRNQLAACERMLSQKSELIEVLEKRIEELVTENERLLTEIAFSRPTEVFDGDCSSKEAVPEAEDEGEEVVNSTRKDSEPTRRGRDRQDVAEGAEKTESPKVPEPRKEEDSKSEKKSHKTEKSAGNEKKNIDDLAKDMANLSVESDSTKSKKDAGTGYHLIHPSLIRSCGRKGKQKEKRVLEEGALLALTRKHEDKEIQYEVTPATTTTTRKGRRCRQEEREVENGEAPTTRKGRRCRQGDKEVENEEANAASRKGRRYARALFQGNDFDNLSDLDSPLAEPEVPRLRHNQQRPT